jgi:hypothetical protein
VNRIVAAFSQLLEPADRECVCGDLEELRLSTPAAAANILGLVVRRQLAEWSHWGPWVALLGVAGLTGPFLSGLLARVEAGILLQIRTYLHYGVAYEAGGVSVAQEIIYAATAAFALLLWSWACGFVLASLSRHAFWITAFLFYCVVLDSWSIRMAMAGNIVLKHGLWPAMLFRLLPLDPFVIAFLFALVLGVRTVRKGALPRSTRLYFTAAGLALVLLLVWMESWFVAGFAHWSGQPYLPTPFLYRVLPWLAGAWPVLLIPLLHGERQKPRQRAV